MSGWHRTSRHDRGYGTAWDKLRLRILRRDSPTGDPDAAMCQACKREGRTSLARHVDHVQPRKRGGSDDPSNLQSLCKRCHDEKTAEENGRTLRPKRKIGHDGWPIEGSQR